MLSWLTGRDSSERAAMGLLLEGPLGWLSGLERVSVLLLHSTIWLSQRERKVCARNLRFPAARTVVSAAGRTGKDTNRNGLLHAFSSAQKELKCRYKYLLLKPLYSGQGEEKRDAEGAEAPPGVPVLSGLE